MKISHVATKCGLSIHTIRYYEEIGICPQISRGADGNRCFSAENLDWLTLLAALRDTGMPIEKMKRLKLDKCKLLVERKLSIYDDMLGRKS